MKALKTNSRQVRDQIKTHILDCVYNPENEQSYNSLEEACNRLFEEFCRVANNPNNLKRLPNDQQRFSDYLNGLPFHFEYWTDEIIKFLNGLGINPTNKDYTTDASMQLYHYLIFSEMQKNKTV